MPKESFTSSLLALVVACFIVVCVAAVGCGKDESDCERYCAHIRPKLIENFGLQPETVDCSDDKWQGDCQVCEAILKNEFEAQFLETCELFLEVD